MTKLTHQSKLFHHQLLPFPILHGPVSFFPPTEERDLSSLKLWLYSVPPSNLLPPVLTSVPTISGGPPTRQSKPFLLSMPFIPFPFCLYHGRGEKNQRNTFLIKSSPLATVMSGIWKTINDHLWNELLNALQQIHFLNSNQNLSNSPSNKLIHSIPNIQNSINTKITLFKPGETVTTNKYNKNPSI